MTRLGAGVGPLLALVVGLGAVGGACTTGTDAEGQDGDRTATQGAAPTTPAAETSSPTPTPAPRRPAPLRGGFEEDFDGSAVAPPWQWLHDAEGWPDQMRRAEVVDGVLELEPWTTAWFEDHHGPMLFREVTGDFVATARVRSRGLRTEVPRKSYSFTGLIARAPRDVTPATWRPGGEDHVFITSGVADDPGEPNLETKTTDDSHSRLTLQPIAAGWTDLAVVRAGEVFVMLFREPDGEWTVSDAFVRPDLPRTVQLGVVVYTDWEDMTDFHADADGYHRTVLRRKPDLRASVDHVSARPLPKRLDVGGFADLGLTELEELLRPVLGRLGAPTSR